MTFLSVFWKHNMKKITVEDISKAAADAVQIIADAATEALKVTSIQQGNDHDLIVELKTKIEGIRDDIKDLKDGTTAKIAEHELRLNTLETNNTRLTVLFSVGSGLVALLVSLLTYHLFQ